MEDSTINEISQLLEILDQTHKSEKIMELIQLVERQSTVDITKQINFLTGVWELKWSSSNSLLINSPLIDNLQILQPKKGLGINLIRPKGFLGNIFSTNIFAHLEIIDQTRINVSFKKVGLLGPMILGKKISFLSEIKKVQEGWLDTTVLTPNLRICKGYKGTKFALIKRNNLSIKDFFNPNLN